MAGPTYRPRVSDHYPGIPLVATVRSLSAGRLRGWKKDDERPGLRNVTSSFSNGGELQWACPVNFLLPHIHSQLMVDEVCAFKGCIPRGCRNANSTPEVGGGGPVPEAENLFLTSKFWLILAQISQFKTIQNPLELENV